jgi:oligopeptide/dipeptide ABC transporter ATP-binding protein
MQSYRWTKIAMVFQGAMNALNPVRTVAEQIAEAIIVHEQAGKAEAARQAGELLEMVGVASQLGKQYPHQFSGGMRQRAMTAMALACSPDILIADEPTTALDVMIQAQILDLFQRLQRQLDLSVILVTHDLGVVAELCDDVLVLYGGRPVEYASVDAIYNEPLHPYTQRLLQAFPDIRQPDASLASIPGFPPPLNALPSGCCFEPRCHLKTSRCAVEIPDFVTARPGHHVACYRVGEESSGTTGTER